MLIDILWKYFQSKSNDVATISLIQVRVEYVQMEDFKYLSQWRKHVSGGQDDRGKKMLTWT